MGSTNRKTEKCILNLKSWMNWTQHSSKLQFEGDFLLRPQSVNEAANKLPNVTAGRDIWRCSNATASTRRAFKCILMYNIGHIKDQSQFHGIVIIIQD